jgi:hypothetical protein
MNRVFNNVNSSLFSKETINKWALDIHTWQMVLNSSLFSKETINKQALDIHTWQMVFKLKELVLIYNHGFQKIK